VTKILDDALESPDLGSILTLRGLGKEHWTGIEPAAHVEAERKSWD
jgi:tripartite-type tricarboxylate transporter receptor subunit TctC